MKFFYFLALICVILNEATASDDVSIKIVNKKKSSSICGKIKADKRVSLLDLTTDCLELVLEQMTVIDLFSLSNTSSTMFYFAERTLKQKLINKEILFQDPYRTLEARDFSQINYETKDTVIMCSLPPHVDIPWIVRHFGHLFHSVEITHGPNSPRNPTKRVVNLINYYCAKTLKGFHITNFFPDIFSQSRKSYEKVLKVSLNGDFENVGELNFLFPAARSLLLSAYTISHLRTYGLKLPQLRHISVADQLDRVSDEMSTVLHNNKAVRFMNVEAGSLKLLQYVSDTMRALYSLTIDRIEYNNDEELIHFEKLKRFIFKGFMQWFPTNIILRDVEEFEVSNVGDSEYLIDYVLDLKMLKKLRLAIKLSDEELLKLAEANLKVTELKIELKPDNDIRIITYLLKNCAQLEVLTIVVQDNEFRRSAFETLQQQVAWKWMFMMDDSHLTLFSKSDFDFYPAETVLE